MRKERDAEALLSEVVGYSLNKCVTRAGEKERKDE